MTNWLEVINSELIVSSYSFPRFRVFIRSSHVITTGIIRIVCLSLFFGLTATCSPPSGQTTNSIQHPENSSNSIILLSEICAHII